MLNFESLRLHRSVYTFRWNPLRVSADAILIAVGVISGFVARTTLERIEAFPSYSGVTCFGYDVRLDWVLMLGGGCLHVGWSLALVGLFGRDFIQAIRR